MVSWRKLECELMEIKPKSIIDRASMLDWSDHLKVSSVTNLKHDLGIRRTWARILSFLFSAYKLEDVILTSLFVINKRLIEPALHHY